VSLTAVSAKRGSALKHSNVIKPDIIKVKHLEENFQILVISGFFYVITELQNSFLLKIISGLSML
jgi:hypothetical protein